MRKLRILHKIQSAFLFAHGKLDLTDGKLDFEERKQNLHLWVKVDQAVRPLPPKKLSILGKTDMKINALTHLLGI